MRPLVYHLKKHSIVIRTTNSYTSLYKVCLSLLLSGAAGLLCAQTPEDSLGTPGPISGEAVPTSLADSAANALPKLSQLVGEAAGGGAKTKAPRRGFFKRLIASFGDADTTYVTPNYYNWTAMLQNTNYFQAYKLAGRSSDGQMQSLATRPEPSVKVGPYLGWRWIFLGYTFDVSHPRSLGQSSEFSFSLYSAVVGADLVYVRNKGNFRLRRADGFEGVEPRWVRNVPLSGMSANTLSISGYYIFNHKHFSYPAAYNQSTVQRISCGSGMLGAGFSQQNIDFDYTQLPAILLGTAEHPRLIDELKFSSVNYNYYYVSGGYAYNWVFSRNWLLGASMMPSVGLRKAKGEKLKGNEVLLDLKNLSFDCTSRVGIVWNNAHWFAGSSFVSHLYLYRKNRLSLTNSVNYFNVYVGFFFNRKKMYRRRPATISPRSSLSAH